MPLSTNVCRHVFIVGDNSLNATAFCKLVNIPSQCITLTDRENFMRHSITDRSIDSLVIDIDSIGRKRAGFLNFLASCLIPNTKVYLITNRALSTDVYLRYLSAGVVAIFQLAVDPQSANAKSM